jgi:hypothetical protein
MADPNLRQITDQWHEFGEFRVCGHWAEFDAPIVDGKAQPVPLARPDGTSVVGSAASDAHGEPVPTRLRSYIGIVLEHGEAQLQVRGRLRLGARRLQIDLADFPG